MNSGPQRTSAELDSVRIEYLDRCNVCRSSDILVIDQERNFCRCAACGYIFDSPRPTQSEIRDFYSRPGQYDNWLEHEAERDILWKRRIRKMQEHFHPGSILDIGAGIGQFLDLARSVYTQVYGTEVSSNAIGVAREKYGLDLVAGDIMQAELPGGGKFDNITMFHVLEHVPDPREVVERCHALLAEGGQLTIAVPNDVLSLRRWSKTRIKRLLAALGAAKYRGVGRLGLPKIDLEGPIDEIHLSHFTTPVLKKLFQLSGFEIVQTSLDPYYVASGFASFKSGAYYRMMSLVKALTGQNLYETIWMVGRKR